MSHNLVCLNGGVLCSRCGAERADNLGPCKFSADAVITAQIAVEREKVTAQIAAEREKVTAQITVERERATAQTRVAFAQVLVATAVILVVVFGFERIAAGFKIIDGHLNDLKLSSSLAIELCRKGGWVKLFKSFFG